MTGRRFHHTTEVIPSRPWKAKSPFASRPMKISIKKGMWGVRTRYDTVLLPFISIVRCPGRLVIPAPETRTANRNKSEENKEIRTNRSKSGGVTAFWWPQIGGSDSYVFKVDKTNGVNPRVEAPKNKRRAKLTTGAQKRRQRLKN